MRNSSNHTASFFMVTLWSLLIFFIGYTCLKNFEQFSDFMQNLHFKTAEEMTNASTEIPRQ